MVNIPDSGDIAPIQILLVEDSPGDINLTIEALRGARVANHLSIVRDGEEAMAFLRQEESYEHVPRPDLILLDLNLPKKDGREVLSDIKSDSELEMIPVIIMTTSAAQDDIVSSYRHHAASFVTKPVDFSEFLEAVRSIEGFWLSIVRYPAKA
jgi:CheY-like chemotaxis protein